MILTQLTFRNVGPFLPKPIWFEKDVTVITGPNDCGKSILLRMIANCLSKNRGESISVNDVNFDHISGCKTPWDDDREICADITFDIPDGKYPGAATANLFLAPKHRKGSPWQRPQMKGTLSDQELQRFPTVIFVKPSSEGIRETIALDDPNEVEVRLLRVAFGPEFQFSALKNLPDRIYQTTISNAEKRLNDRLNRILPPTLSYSFRFTSYSDKRDQLCVNIEDFNGGTTGLGARGTGIQALINLIGSLATENFPGTNVIILLDEPESHLHADAQHSLRRALEKLGSSENIQVIYATHSPCMVNPMRPQSIRVLERIKKDDKAYTHTVKSPYAEGFSLVRSSLGISLADSLLLAPVTVIVEGKTEILCIPYLLKRLSDSKKLSEDLDKILPQTIFLEAVGVPNIPNLVRISQAQGSKAIAFIDGHKSARWKVQIEKCEGNVPLIVCVKDGEFEEIVSRSVYFEALKAKYDETAERISLEAFTEWESDLEEKVRQFSFTNKLERWFSRSAGFTKTGKTVGNEDSFGIGPN